MEGQTPCVRQNYKLQNAIYLQAYSDEIRTRLLTFGEYLVSTSWGSKLKKAFSDFGQNVVEEFGDMYSGLTRPFVYTFHLCVAGLIIVGLYMCCNSPMCQLLTDKICNKKAGSRDTQQQNPNLNEIIVMNNQLAALQTQVTSMAIQIQNM